jgi:formyl-CoA transferase
LRRLDEHDVPAAKCLSYDEVLAHPQFAANGSIDVHEHPVLGRVRRIKPPVEFAGERFEPASDCPAHGEHTREVLTELGRSAADIDRLFEQAVAR